MMLANTTGEEMPHTSLRSGSRPSQPFSVGLLRKVRREGPSSFENMPMKLIPAKEDIMSVGMIEAAMPGANPSIVLITCSRKQNGPE